MTDLLPSIPYLLRALLTTVVLAATGIAGSFLLGTLLALARLSPWKLLRASSFGFVFFLRTIPLLDVVFWVFFALPLILGQAIPALLAAIVAIVAYESSYLSEVVRSGFLAVPRGIREAAQSSGLSSWQYTWHIQLPIALRAMLPALLTQYKAIVMATSVVYVVGVTDFFAAANNVNNQLYRPFMIFALVLAVYFSLCYTITLCSNAMRRRLARRGQATV